jgi:tetratricopeptide (TPR) repeat protein
VDIADRDGKIGGPTAVRGGFPFCGFATRLAIRYTVMMRFRPWLLLLAALPGCGVPSVIQQSREHARLGDYRHAFEVLEVERRAQLARYGEVDEEVQKEHQAMRLEFLRHRARMRIFAEREDDALRDLQALEEAAPDYPEIEDLRQRALQKKAGRIVTRADELLAQRELQGAMALYLESQRIVPGFEPAEAGMQEVRDSLAAMDARAQQQFLEAVRKLPEFRFIEVQWHAANVMNNAPGREDAQEIRKKARKENARETFRRGQECEQKDQFGAAMVLYRAALQLDPELTEAQQAIDAMQQEMEALTLVERAQIDMRSGRFDAARENLGMAFEKSKLSRGTISELMIQVRQLEGQSRYKAARDLEILGKKKEALSAFEALAKDWPEGFSDEQARISTLRIDLEGAEREWALAEAAEEAGDLTKALEHYRNSELFYAGWRDGKARIENLRERIAKQQTPGGS